ncbi:hypothetical protein SAMN04488691_11421 [Haloferax larsenii]|uniref:Uncharacterized protein n=1 Tax=Haloferax larsenii TaxID=302484 RepID=A0A1H7UT52_HALLR|nr:hypothetical protein SAMN04488691_11421 [Haloferax larsenii]
MPVQWVLQETRLQHDLKKGEMWRCSQSNVGIYQKEWMARHLVETHSIDKPENSPVASKIHSNQFRLVQTV